MPRRRSGRRSRRTRPSVLRRAPQKTGKGRDGLTDSSDARSPPRAGPQATATANRIAELEAALASATKARPHCIASASSRLLSFRTSARSWGVSTHNKCRTSRRSRLRHRPTRPPPPPPFRPQPRSSVPSAPASAPPTGPSRASSRISPPRRAPFARVRISDPADFTELPGALGPLPESGQNMSLLD